MKFKIIESTSRYDFENQLEYNVEELETNGNEIVDVKYGGINLMTDNWSGAYYYNAMIIYK